MENKKDNLNSNVLFGGFENNKDSDWVMALFLIDKVFSNSNELKIKDLEKKVIQLETKIDLLEKIVLK